MSFPLSALHPEGALLHTLPNPTPAVFDPFGFSVALDDGSAAGAARRRRS